MGILGTVLRPEPRASVSWSVLDDRWYQDLGLRSDAGLALNADTIFRCGVVLAAVRFLADAWAMCPPNVGVRTADSRTMDPRHYAQRVLRNPNAWQTGFRWRHVNMTWATTWGNSYNRILGGRSAFVEELRPIHPSRCRVVDQRSDGSLVYEYTPVTGPAQRLGQEEVLHFRGISLDGLSGAPMYALIRNAVGIALLAERHTSTFLKKGSRLAGLLVPTGAMEATQRTALRDSWNEAFGGSENTGTVGVLPFGVSFTPVASDNQKAQLLELRDFQVGDALRFLGVPGVVVGYGEKTATYASAKEFFESGGIKHCVLPWVTNFEQEAEKALLVEGDDHYIKYNLDVLLRANTKDRFEALFKAIGRPWMSVNEGRRIEDMNPDDDPASDEIARPVNMDATGSEPEEPEPEPTDGAPPAPPKPRPPVKPPPDDGEEDARLIRSAWQFATDAAARVVRREVATIKGSNGSRGAAVRFAGDSAAWRAWVEDFYEKHAAHVAAALHMPEPRARAYAAQQREALLAGGLATVELWEETVTPRLAALALGE